MKDRARARKWSILVPMPMGRVLGICLLLAGCDVVWLTAVEGPDDSESDAEVENAPDAADDESGDAESAEASIEQPPNNLDAGSDTGPAMNTPIDASSADAGLIEDAGDDAASSASDAGPDAMLPPCGGRRVFDLCWYLGRQGASCRQTCGDKGGFDARAVARLGTAAQGGSLRACSRVLGALGYPGSVTPGYRSDDAGLGCHLWEERDAWWLETMPDWSPSASISVASIVCACLR